MDGWQPDKPEMVLDAAAVKAEGEAGTVKNQEIEGEGKDVTAVAAAVRDEPNLRLGSHVFIYYYFVILFFASII